MKNQLNKLHYIQLSRRLLPSVQGDPKKIALANQCLQKLDNHFLKKIDSIDSHKTYINALFYSLPLLEEFNQYIDPAYMRGLMDSMAFLELHLSDNAKLKAYAEKAALILDMYINMILTQYLGKEITKKDALDFCSTYITRIENYLFKAGFTDYKENGSAIVRDLYQQKANRFKEKVDFLRPVFQAHADRYQQLIDTKSKNPERLPFEDIAGNLALVWVLGSWLSDFFDKLHGKEQTPWKDRACTQVGSYYPFHSSSSNAEKENLIPPALSDSSNKCTLM